MRRIRGLRGTTAIMAAIAAGVAGGCAGSQHTPIASAAEDAAANGIRYYQPAKYVLLYADGKGGVKWEWLTLPDQSQLMSVDPTVYLAAGETTLEFTNGTLLKQDETGDATAVPAAVVTAIETVLKSAALGIFNKVDEETKGKIEGPVPVPPPRLYKLICSADGTWKLSGEYSTVPVLITLPPEAK